MKTRYVLPVLLGLCSVCHSQQPQPTPEEAYRYYRDYLYSIRNVSFDSHFQDRVAEKSSVFTNAMSERWKVDLKGHRLWRTTQVPATSPDKTGPEDGGALQYSELLLTSDAVQQLSVIAEEQAMIGISAYLNVPANYWNRYLPLQYVSFPFGYIQAGQQYEYIPDLIHESSKSIDSQKEESAAVLLVCETEEFTMSIRLDGSKGWMADRIELRRKTIVDGVPVRYLYTVEHSTNHNGVWLPDKYHCEIARPAYQQTLPGNLRIVDGSLVKVGDGSTLGKNVVKKPKTTLVAEVVLLDVDLSPLSDSDFEFQTVIPNGTKVTMQDAPHLEFMWQDGKIVPVTAETLKTLQNSRFFGGTRSRHFWLVINTVVLVVLVLSVAIMRWMKTARRS